MHVPRPTVAPPGRLVRLGVVLDTRNPIERLREVARMCDRAGIGALWVEDLPDGDGAGGRGDGDHGGADGRDAGGPDDADSNLGDLGDLGDRGGDGAGGPARLDAWTALAALAGEVRAARIGAVLDPAAWHPRRLARMAATLGALTGGRFELTLRRAAAAADSAGGAGGSGGGGGAVAAEVVRGLREAIEATTVPAAVGTSTAPTGGPVYGAAALPAEPPSIGVEVDASNPRAGAEIAAVLPLVDDLVLPRATLADTMAAAAAAREVAAAAGRPGSTVGVAARLPVSVGRTVAEAQARWQAEPAFAALGAPADAPLHGLYGTLEQCHDRVVALAHAGVSDLRCLLPNAIDVHDVIAQLTAMTIGTVERSVPGAPRTRVPSPPPGWGGRSRFPRPG
jgi:alkanesulfonate monooxygenase SsuD/methylene tetrahydromethanopterin reductase-like flavin-dependent oxidoreductase (luciferase family)